MHNARVGANEKSEEKTMSRCIIARRVSTDEQSLGLEAQLHACEAYAASHGLTVAGVYDDDGVSGAAGLEKRTGMLAAIAAIEKGTIVLVSKRDRLGRDPIVVAMIESAVNRKGGRIVSVAGEGTESDDPTSILMRRIVDAFGEYERLIIKSRTKQSLAAKHRRGERTTRAKYGWDVGPDGVKMAPNAAEQGVIVHMTELRAAGKSYRAIAEHLNASGIPTKEGGKRWEPMTVSRVLSRQSQSNSVKPCVTAA